MKNILTSIKTPGASYKPMQIGAGVLVLGVFAFMVLITFSNVDYDVLFSGLQPEMPPQL